MLKPQPDHIHPLSYGDVCSRLVIGHSVRDDEDEGNHMALFRSIMTGWSQWVCLCVCICVCLCFSLIAACGPVLKMPICEPPQHLKTQVLVPFQVNCGAIHEQWEYNCSSFRKLASNAPFYRHKEADWHLIFSYYSFWKVKCQMIHDAHVSFVSAACFCRVWTPRKVKYHKEVREVSWSARW